MTRFFRNIGRMGKKAALAPFGAASSVGKYLANTEIGKQAIGGVKDFVKGPAKDFLVGTPQVQENLSTLRPEQEPLYQQAVNAGLDKGAGGAFGDVADYHRSNLGDDPADFDAFAAPELRRYNEQTVPQLAHQFAGMGAGALSSSGFLQSQNAASTDLSERLAQIRAGLRQSSAQGLQNIGQIGLNPYSQPTVTDPGSEGFLSNMSKYVGPALTAAAGSYFGVPPAVPPQPRQGQNSYGANKVGRNSGPYNSGDMPASPQLRQLPNRSF